MENAIEEPGSPLREQFRRSLALLRDKEKRHRLLPALLSKIRLLLGILSASYLVFLLLLCTVLHYFAEANITLVFLSFLPAIIWLLPLGGLFLLSLPLSRRLALLQSLAAAAYVWFYMDFEISASGTSAPDERSLTVLSYNRGQHHNQSFEPFVTETQPDIIVLQESFGRSGIFRSDPRFADFPFIEGSSDFVILSKYPVGEIATLPTVERNRTRHLAARFEIDFEGAPIAIYAVHQPTLRDTLGYYRRGAFLCGLLGFPGTAWGRIRAEEDAFWSERTNNARTLSAAIEADALPAIAAGDFNMPDHGMIYRTFTRHLNDAHEESGRGFGYTFPGQSENILAAIGPWLRLDYIFSSPAWKTIAFVTETKRTSQHRAIAATLSLRAPPTANAR